MLTTHATIALLLTTFNTNMDNNYNNNNDIMST